MDKFKTAITLKIMVFIYTPGVPLNQRDKKKKNSEDDMIKNPMIKRRQEMVNKVGMRINLDVFAAVLGVTSLICQGRAMILPIIFSSRY